MIDSLIDAGKYLVTIFSEKQKMKKARKQQLSSTLKTIGDLLQATANDLRNDIYPHGSCTAMENLADNLIQELEGFLNEEQVKDLKFNLQLASRLEQLYAERKAPGFIDKIEQASGHFYAVSILTSF